MAREIGFQPGPGNRPPEDPPVNPPPGSPPTTGGPTSGPAYDLGRSLGLSSAEASQFAQKFKDGDEEGAWSFAVTTSGFKAAHPGFTEGYVHWGTGPTSSKVGAYNQAKSEWDSAAKDYGYTPTAADYADWATNGYSGSDVKAHISARQPGGAYEAVLKRYGFSDAQIQIWKNYHAGFGPDTDSIGSFGDFVILHNDDLVTLGHTNFGLAKADFDADPQGNITSSAASHIRNQRDTPVDNSVANQAASEARQEAERKARIERAATGIQASYDPSIQALFTPDELHNAAIADAGGEWGDFKAAKEIALASPINQYFQHFYGRAPTRAEIDQYYASGATPEYVNQTLDSLGIQRAFPPDLQGMFTPQEIKAYSDEKAGIHTPDGSRIAGIVDAAMQFNPIYRQYHNRPASRQEVEDLMSRGVTPDAVRGIFGGQSWTQANQADVQYYSGAFGAGQLSPQQQQILGAQKAGYTTPLGEKLQTQFDKAVERARTSFQGTVAHMEKNNQFGQTTLPDLGT